MLSENIVSPPPAKNRKVTGSASSKWRRTQRALRAEIEALQRQDGSFNPKDMVEWARENPGSLLHKSFQWDDTVAAEQYRLSQARGLLQRFEIVESKRDPVPEKFISVSTRRKTDDGSYLSRTAVAADDVLRADALKQARSQLRATKAKFGWLDELSDVWAAIPDA